MTQQQWARLKGEENRGLRRGAWYRVVQLTPHDAVVAVRRTQVALPRSSLKFASLVPQAWTVVPCPPDIRGLPRTWGDMYAVCPACRNRAPLKGSPRSLRCARCGGVFKVAWEEWLIGQA